MKKITLPVCLAAFLALGIGCGSNQSSDTTSITDTTKTTTTESTATMTDTSTANAKDTSMAGDKNFVMEAASGGMMEVELGKIAQSNASSAKVKEFGKMMVTDHTKANNELKAVAAKNNITVPPAPAEKEQSHIDELKGKKGADFDKAYVDMMVDDHKTDISKFEDEAKNGTDADVKAFATKTLPVLNKHLDHITAIQAGMKH